MAERKKLAARPKGSADEERKEVRAAKKDVTEGVKNRRVPYDTHPDTHSKLSMMRAMSLDNVPVKSFLDEAVEDLFEKYRRREGRFKVKDIDRILRD